jgi:6-phosphogluconate dehydrogenase
MQLLAEVYDLMRRMLHMPVGEVAAAMTAWNTGALGSFLVEITGEILETRDADSGLPLVDLVEDTAEQKGTGAWASVAALEYGVPAPTIAEAAMARALSARKERRVALAELWAGRGEAQGEASLADLEAALVVGQLAAFAQGFELIRAASDAHDWAVDLASVARVWRAGCIIRARLLDTILLAYEREPGLESLLFDNACRNLAGAAMPGLRHTVTAAAAVGIPVPALASALSWVDGCATSRLPANLVQAQRDRFGAHTFQRIDKPGRFHADWAGRVGR